MEELQLLLHWREAATKGGTGSAKLLPVLYGLTYEELQAQAEVYRKAAAGQIPEGGMRMEPWAVPVDMLGQWAQLLDKLGGITSVRQDQVGQLHTSHPRQCQCVVVCWGLLLQPAWCWYGHAATIAMTTAACCHVWLSPTEQMS
jgi:hypothetical protein